MMKTKHFSVLLAGLATSVALAQSGTGSGTSASGQQEATTSVAQLEPRTENGVTYLCGGIGQEEQVQMKQAASDYDLMMTFAASNGAYVADVEVDIADARGQSVLSANCDAPIMLVDFDKGGSYRVKAETAGRTLTRTARVNDRGQTQRLRLAWPTQVVDMGLTPTMQAEVLGEGQTSSGASGASGESGSSQSQSGGSQSGQR